VVQNILTARYTCYDVDAVMGLKFAAYLNVVFDLVVFRERIEPVE